MTPDLQEAYAILKGETLLLTEKRHLEALHMHYQIELISLVHDIEQLTQRVLKRN